MGLYEEMKEFVKNKFGEFSAAKIDNFKLEVDPETHPREFLDKCVDFLATLFGEEKAKQQLQSFYDKYS